MIDIIDILDSCDFFSAKPNRPPPLPCFMFLFHLNVSCSLVSLADMIHTSRPPSGLL